MKKAQSALEFLTTYGWAFLVILIMIGALAYFGILNPSRYLPDRCTVTPGIECMEFEIAQDADTLVATIVLGNKMGHSIAEFSATAASETGTGDCDFVNRPNGDDIDGAILQDTSFTLECMLEARDGLTHPRPGTKHKVSFNIVYTPSGRTLSQSVSGEVFGQIRE
jgi:hypothetical protein